MKGLTIGDEARVAEAKEWLKQGMKPKEVEAALKELGYNKYHIAFILEEATGKKLVPAKPVIDLLPGLLRKLVLVVAIAVVLAVLAWVYFKGWTLW